MRVFKLLFLTAIVAAGVSAGPITFTFSGTGSGTIGGSPFASAAFTITALADTVNIVPFSVGTGFSLDNSSASITIAGQGTFSFITATREFVNNNSSGAGFSRGTQTGADLVYAASDPGFATYALDTAFDPLTGNGRLLQWSNPTVTTSGGTLVFTDANPTTVTFQATVGAAVPEPGSYVLILSGILGLVLMKRSARRA